MQAQMCTECFNNFLNGFVTGGKLLNFCAQINPHVVVKVEVGDTGENKNMNSVCATHLLIFMFGCLCVVACDCHLLARG